MPARAGADILCEVIGFAMSSDASDIVMPSKNGAARAMAGRFGRCAGQPRSRSVTSMPMALEQRPMTKPNAPLWRMCLAHMQTS